MPLIALFGARAVWKGYMQGVKQIEQYSDSLATNSNEIMVFAYENDKTLTQLTTLEAEHAKLSAQYEQVFDMEKIQAAVGDTMVRPVGGQAVYLDLSEPDTVVVYDNLKDNKLMDALSGVGRTLGDLIEYFR